MDAYGHWFLNEVNKASPLGDLHGTPIADAAAAAWLHAPPAFTARSLLHLLLAVLDHAASAMVALGCLRLWLPGRRWQQAGTGEEFWARVCVAVVMPWASHLLFCLLVIWSYPVGFILATDVLMASATAVGLRAAAECGAGTAAVAACAALAAKWLVRVGVGMWVLGGQLVCAQQALLPLCTVDVR